MTRRIPAPLALPPDLMLSRVGWRVLSVLQEGEQTSKADLMSRVQTNERSVRAAVRELRRAGLPVVSTSAEKGYHFTSDPVELDGIIADLRSRIEDEAVTVAALERTQVRLRAETTGATQLVLGAA